MRQWGSDETMNDFEAQTLPHYGTIIGYFRNRYPGTGHHDADDLAQDTYRNAWIAWPRYRPSESVLPWLYSIAQNVLRNRHRGDARKPAQRLQEWADHPKCALDGPEADAPGWR